LVIPKPEKLKGGLGHRDGMLHNAHGVSRIMIPAHDYEGVWICLSGKYSFQALQALATGVRFHASSVVGANNPVFDF